MATLHEKYLWPLIGIIIFVVLAAFYVDDRRGLMRENSNAMEEQASNDSSHGATSMSIDEYPARAEGKAGNSGNHTGGSYSGSIEGYLAKYGDNSGQSSNTTSNADHSQANAHTGFHGSYEEYAKKYK